MGDVMGNLNSRRGRIEGMEARGGAQVIRAMVPLSEMFGYATDLRSQNAGHAASSPCSSPIMKRCRRALLEKVTGK